MIPEASQAQYREQQRITGLTATSVRRLWRRLGADFTSDWARVGPQVLTVVERGRAAAVTAALPYTAAVLAETGQTANPKGELIPDGFLVSAPDGRTVVDVLEGGVISARQAVGAGLATQAALEIGGTRLLGDVLTMLADTRRQVYHADIISRPRLAGYARMLNAPSCSRCVVLAGKWFRWNQGFQRHPRCDCIHVPASENVAGDIRTDPYAYFRSLSREQQDKVFTKSGARAIRDGADMYRVENVRLRGLSSPRSRQAAKYGTPTRVTVDDIYRTAGNRTNAIRMLQEEGYITGAQTPGGNIIGTGPQAERFAGMTRGRGTYTVGGVQVKTARASVVDARTSGVRDPLNRATMTAGERRIYDDFYRAEASLRGLRPRTIGANSADAGIRFDLIDPEKADAIQAAFIRRIDRVRKNGTASERRLAGILWARYNAQV
jgi:hypothetical protein